MNPLVEAQYRSRLCKDTLGPQAQAELLALRQEKRTFDSRINDLIELSEALKNRVLELERSIKGSLTEQPAAEAPIATRRPSVRDIIAVVSAKYEISAVDIISSRRHSKLVRCRQIVCYLANKHTYLSYPAIGRHVGGRDHTTALYAVQKMKWLLSIDDVLAGEIREIELSLGLTNERGIKHEDTNGNPVGSSGGDGAGPRLPAP